MADAQTIDTLAIKITSSVKGTSKLEKFTGALNGLASTSNKVNTQNLSACARSLSEFSASLKGIDTKGVKNLSDSLSRLATVNVNVGGINSLTASIKSLSDISSKVKGVNNLVNSLRRLGSADLSGFNPDAFDKMTSGLHSLASSLSEVKGINANTAKVVNAIAKLSDSGKYVERVTAELPRLGNALVRLVKDLKQVGQIDANMARLVSGIAQLANAGNKALTVADNLDRFGDSVVRLVRKLQGVGTIDVNLANTIHGLGNLAQSGKNFGSVANSASTATHRFKNAIGSIRGVIGKANGAFRSLISNMRSTKKTTNELVSKIGMFYAKYFLILRGIRGLGNVTGSAQDYIESFNYFNVALQKIGQDSKDQYKRFGYEDAETYADSFQDRFKKLQKQMTGFDINSRTGDLTYKAGKSLGLNPTDVMQYQAQIAQITNSTGQLGEVSVMASKAMSMLSADFSSLTNTDLTQVQENFMSALNGQTRAVYKYGINLTSASLQQVAYNHGISDSVAKLSMATKQQLRLIGMLEQSKVAMGDLARTINQPANQLRMLKAGFANLGRTIGAIFMPALQAIYPILNGIVMVLQEFLMWIMKIAGIKMPKMDSYKPPEIDKPADDMDKFADNTDKASKKAKKLSDNLQGFDEINKLDDNKSSDSDTNPLKGVKDYDLSSDLADLYNKYRKLWNKNFNGMQNLAEKWAKKIKDALLKGWRDLAGNFSFLGKKFGAWFSKTLAKIPWGKIQKGINKITKSFATFIDGVIKGTNWETVGHSIAEFFNTIVGAIYTWYDNIDFLNLGQSLAKGVNKFVNDFDWRKFGAMLGKKLRSMIQLAYGYVTNVDFPNIVNKAFEGVKGFLKEMGSVDPRTGLSGWQEFEKGLAKAFNSLVNTFKSIYEKIDFIGLGKRLATGFNDLINDIDWVGLGNALGEKIRKWIQLAFSFITNIDFENLAGKITSAVNSFLDRMGKIDPDTGLSGWAELGQTVNKGAKGLLDGIYKILDELDWDAIAKAISDFLGNIDWFEIFLKVGKVIAKALWEAIKTGIKAFVNDPLHVGGAIVTVLAGLFAFGKLKKLIGIIRLNFGRVFGIGLKGAMKQGVTSSALESAMMGGTGGSGLFSGLLGKLKNGASSGGGWFKNLGSLCVTNFKAGLKWDGLKGAFKGLGATLKTGFGGVLSKASTVTGAIPVVGALATAYGSGKVIGKMVSDVINEGIEADNAKLKADHARGASLHARDRVKIKDNLGGMERNRNLVKANTSWNKYVLNQNKGIAERSQKETDKQESEYRRRDTARQARMNELKYGNEFKLAKMSGDIQAMKKLHDEYETLIRLRGEDAKYIMEQRGANEKIQKEYERQIEAQKGLLKLKKNGILSEKEYQKAVSQSISKNKTKEQAVDQAISKNKDYAKAVQTLASNLSNANVPMEQQKAIMNTLKEKLANGEISMKKYKDIVQKCGGNVQKLNSEISKIKPNKKVTVSLHTSGLNSVKKAIQSIPKQIPVNVTITKSGGGTVSNAEYGARYASASVAGMGGSYTEMVKQGLIKFNGKTVMLKKSIYNAWKDRFKNWGYKVKKFEKGGIIEDGLFTMNRGEIAGKFNNGKSVVANNQQITEGFARSITQTLAPAIYSAVKQGIKDASGGDGQAVKVYLDGKQLADNSVKYIRQMNRSNGSSVFA